MKLISADAWLRSPLDRDIIENWTAQGARGAYELAVPSLDVPDDWSFLVLGDSGDSDFSGGEESPQEAVARIMAEDSAAPGFNGPGRLILHTGDVVYMTGEFRLYDVNFRRPYAAFLTPESTPENLCFEIPFLPVPGNHDYYDPGLLVRWMSGLPILGAGVRTVMRQFFSFSLPEGGSNQGEAYMRAFVHPDAQRLLSPLMYQPREQTRLPNRYYRFTCGNVDFFALDSNTLDAPAPDEGAGEVRQDAREAVKRLKKEQEVVQEELSRLQSELEDEREHRRRALSADAAEYARVVEIAEGFHEDLSRLRSRIQEVGSAGRELHRHSEPVGSAVRHVERRWEELETDLRKASEPDSRFDVLNEAEDADNDVDEALRALERLLSELPQGSFKAEVLSVREDLEERYAEWCSTVGNPPSELAERVREHSERILDIQRDLAVARRRMRYRPEDYDADQYNWLRNALRESVLERPGNWRVVYMHHPPYTSIVNHCEGRDVRDVRANLLPILQEGQVDAVFSGHSHAFEWFRSSEVPNMGLFVTGGGGQISLRPSVIEPGRLERHRGERISLAEAGALSAATAGNGPPGPDGRNKFLYHYLLVHARADALEITPVGVRHTGEAFEREQPLPVFFTEDVAGDGTEVRYLQAVRVRRDAPPEPVWADR